MVCSTNQISFLKDLVFGYILLTMITTNSYPTTTINRDNHIVSQEHEKAKITVYTDVRSFWWARDVETTGVKAISGSSSSTSDTSDTTTTIIATFGNSSKGNSSSNIKKRDSRRMCLFLFLVLISI